MTASFMEVLWSSIMEHNDLIEKATEYIKKIFAHDYSGHDAYHTLRVYRTAVTIAEQEHADLRIVQLAALLHDVDDIKLSPQTNQTKEHAVQFMKSNHVDQDVINAVITVIDEVSFAGNESLVPSTIEGACVQDADRLDAIGAIGIARAFSYGGSHNRAMYDPAIIPNTEMDKVQYYANVSTTVNHFYEKLLTLKDLMNTDAAKRIACRRDRYMREFLQEFQKEWDGER